MLPGVLVLARPTLAEAVGDDRTRSSAVDAHCEQSSAVLAAIGVVAGKGIQKHRADDVVIVRASHIGDVALCAHRVALLRHVAELAAHPACVLHSCIASAFCWSPFFLPFPRSCLFPYVLLRSLPFRAAAAVSCPLAGLSTDRSKFRRLVGVRALAVMAVLLPLVLAVACSTSHS